jgi:hypothetical protein
MTIERLVAMVNDIAAFFEAEAGPSAPEAVAAHLRRFWAPPMRRQISQAFRLGDPALAGLSATARQAISVLAAGSDGQ